LDPGGRRSERRLAIPRGLGARTNGDDGRVRRGQGKGRSNALEDIILWTEAFGDFNLDETYLGDKLTLVLRYVKVILHLNQPLSQLANADLPINILAKHCSGVRT
jgi:hypothetical protein